MSLQEGGRAVNSFMEAMKTQPLALALCVMNVGLLGFLYYSAVEGHRERNKEMELLYDNRREMAQLLYKCSPQTEQH
jgi:hypothetical protein